jgi:hypothetical protein
VLALLSRGHENIVVAGSFGKTTSVSMMAHCLVSAGLDPSWMIGAVPLSPARVSNAGMGAGEAVLRQALGVQRREVVARADDDRLGLDGPAAGLEPGRSGGAHRRLAQEGHAETLGEPGGELRDRVARFDARLVGAVERAREFARPQAHAEAGELARLYETALGPHIRFKERLDHCARFGAPRDHEQAALDDRDFRGVGDLDPDFQRSLGAPPAVAGLLSGDSDEAEVPDRGAVGLSVPVDHDDPLSAPGGCQGMGEAANACADDGKIVRMGPGHRSSNGELTSVRADLLAGRPRRESALEARFHDSASTVYALPC